MRVFITGISSGIGRALVKQLLAEGHEVFGIARRADLLASLAREVGSPRLFVAVCDVADPVAVQECAARMRVDSFIPDVCILNAGVFIPDVGDAFDFAAHQESFKVNLDGALQWVSEFLPDFLARARGTFIAVSSTAAFRPSGSASYSASKAALSMAFRQLAMSFSERGVVFSTMHFGPVDTRLWPGRRLFLVPPPEDAARALLKLCYKKSGSYFFPRVTTSLLRASLVVPDPVFRWCARLLRPTPNP